MHRGAASSPRGPGNTVRAVGAAAAVLLACCVLTIATMAWLGAERASRRAPSGTVAELEAHIARLESTVSSLRGQLKQSRAAASRATAGTGGGRPLKATQVAVDLYSMLGGGAFYSGISFDTHKCGAPLKVLFPNATAAQLRLIQDKFIRELSAAMSKVVGKEVRPTSSFATEVHKGGGSWEDAWAGMAEHPRTEEWRQALTVTMSRYLFTKPFGSTAVRSVLTCPTAPTNATIKDVGQPFCPELSSSEVLRQVGYHPTPHHYVEGIVKDLIQAGVCTKSPDMVQSYGNWLIEKRMHNEEWKTFDVENLDQDAVVFLYDVLYEHLGVFKKQMWLGSIMMQHPFDMLSIADIIWTVKPDLIIETGTANGGSALLWASLMHLNGIENGRVVTLDAVQPNWKPGTMHWGGQPKADATKHPLWAKHVTFLEGFTQQRHIWEQVKGFADKAKSVLVLLDSMHTEQHVMLEAMLYCAFVTPGSYCVLEDTKLSRYSANGPLEAAFKYTQRYPNDFVIDRERELIFTHHANGYLRRVKVDQARPAYNATAPS